ncbi:MAG TPA: sugar phosphate isomerase/epimerase [Candidatus Scybalocola faecigallinarum]|uniref:Sugar phosphate isomerase/epimerase n=1 Tax=Candidatus Scybalocola faecigallinarum TaxID=2840941 RepID=A0A9D1F4P1_9FIRM|nr:sugar phosphate isomerase/epimerase [Candidatus Scybalocola faecigallinarum]
MKFKQSVASFSFHGLLEEKKMDIFHYLETCRFRYGLDTADIWNGFITTYDDDYLKKVRQALDERELTLVNLCCDFAHPWADNEADLKRQNDVAADCLKAAKILGAKTIRFDLGVHTLEMTDEQIDYTSKKFREYARFGANEGFKVCFENHWGASTVFEVVETMFDAINDDNFGLLLHLGNWANSTLEEKDAKDRAMASRAIHMHFSQPYCERVDKVLKPIYDAGYKGVWGTEHHTGKNEYNEVAFQLAAMKRELTRIECGVY